jgi:arylsulfatase A-like enzyme
MYPNARFAIVVLGLAHLLGACGGGRDRPRRVVLVSIDTLRADHLGAYGYERPTSPGLDALALEGTLFEDAMSASPWTLPSHATLLTGLYPNRHGLTSHEHYLASTTETLAQRFARAGFRTAAVVNSHNLSPDFGLDRGFEQYRYVEEEAGQREPSTAITDQAMDWLTAAGEARLFLFLHYYDVHSDYASRPELEEAFLRPYDGAADGTTAQLIAHREGQGGLSASDAPNLIDRYDAGIRQMDDELGRLLTFLRDEGLMEETLLVVTSDHGEEFFEHGGVLHGQTQFQEVLHVPLLLCGPGIPKHRRVKSPVSLVDVTPTLLDAAGISQPPGLDGIPLEPLWGESEAKSGDRYLFSEADHNNVEDDITRAVRYEGFKLHYNRLSREYHLFDLGADPGERVDVAAQQDEVVAALSQKLETFLARGGAEAPVRRLSDEELEKLRSLGYLR